MADESTWGLGKTHQPHLLFDLGTVRWSTAALGFLQTVCGDKTPKEYATQFVMRHAQGDHGDPRWGPANKKEGYESSEALIISTYQIKDTTLVLVTVARDSATLVMMPEDMDEYDSTRGLLTVTTEDD